MREINRLALAAFFGYIAAALAIFVVGHVTAFVVCKFKIGVFLIIPLALLTVVFEKQVHKQWNKTSVVFRGEEEDYNG